MKYKSAQEILPDRLLKELQQYVSGETIYVPKADEKSGWGERTGAKLYYSRRNEAIRRKAEGGLTIEELADEYHLSTDSIRKILFCPKKQND